MKLRIPTKYNNNFFDILEKAIKNLDEYEFSQFRFIQEYQLALLEYLHELTEGIMIGLCLKLEVDPSSVRKSYSFPMYDLLKASQGEITEEALLMKSLWTELRDKYKKAIDKFQSFGIGKKKKLEPIQFKGKVIYNPETKQLMTNAEWESFNKDVVNYFKDNIDLEDETIVRAGLFGLLLKWMDEEGIDKEEQKRMSYDNIVDKYGERINDKNYIKKEIDRNEQLSQAIKFAKENAAKYLSIQGDAYTKIRDIVRKNIVSGLEDGLSKQEMISRLYHVDLEDELGKDLTNETKQAYERDLRRIILTETSMAMNNGYLAAGLQDSLKTGEKKYFIYSGEYNKQEKPDQPCNKWIGKVCLLVPKSRNSDIANDEFAEYYIWVGKDAIGKKWIAIPSHPHCTHFWSEFHPEFQQYNPEINAIEWKVEKSFRDKKLDLLKNDSTKETINFKGLDIAIEWRKGETREYPGSPYKNLMEYDYGYIKNTDSPDGEDIDVCINRPIKQYSTIYMLIQKLDGKFDELKFGIGFGTAQEFESKYIKTMTKEMFGGIIPMSLKKFKDEMKFYFKKKELRKSSRLNHKYIKKIGEGKNAEYIYKEIKKEPVFLGTEEDYDKWVNENYKKYIDEFYIKNKEILEDVSSYSGNSYDYVRERFLNVKDRKLFKGKDLEETNKIVDKQIKNIRNYINNNPLKNNIIVYRGVMGKLFTEDLKEGDIFQSPSFSSWTGDKFIAFTFAKHESENGALMEITFPKGSKVAPALRRINDSGIVSMGFNSIEMEFLAIDGMKFKIKKKYKSKKGRTILEVEVINE